MRGRQDDRNDSDIPTYRNHPAGLSAKNRNWGTAREVDSHSYFMVQAFQIFWLRPGQSESGRFSLQVLVEDIHV
jgi:hypothetical protein